EMLHIVDGLLRRRVVLGADSEHAVTPLAVPGVLQGPGVQEWAVVVEEVPLALERGRISRIDPGERPQSRGRVGDGSGHGPDHVLAVGDGDHAGPTGESKGRLDAGERRRV